MTSLETEIENLTAELGEPTADNRVEWCIEMASLYIANGFIVAPIKFNVEAKPKCKMNYGNRGYTNAQEFEQAFLELDRKGSKGKDGKPDGYSWWIGLQTGAGYKDDGQSQQRYYVIDVDVKNDGKGWDTLERLYGDVNIPTLQANTPSGGAHFFFSRQASYGEYPKRTSNRDWPDLDFLGDGIFAACFPCTGYTFTKFADIAPLPDKLIPLQRQTTVNAPAHIQQQARGVQQATTDDDLTSMHPVRKTLNDNHDLCDLLESLGYVYVEYDQQYGNKYRHPDSSEDGAASYVRPAHNGYPELFCTFQSGDPLNRDDKGRDYFSIWCETQHQLDDIKQLKQCLEKANDELKAQGLEIDRSDVGLGFNPDTNAQGNIVANLNNYIQLFDSPLFTTAFGEIRLNTFSNRLYVGEDPVNDAQTIRLRRWVDTTIFPRMSKDMCQDTLVGLGFDNKFDPLREYFQKLPEWDGTDYIQQAIDEISVHPTGIVRRMFEKWLIGAVSRATTRNPQGVKFDQILILHGAQGVGKSSVLRALTPSEEWFLDDIGKGIISGYGKTDELRKLSGKFIVEVAELEAFRDGRNGSVNEAIKGFLSTQVDNYRVSYARFNDDYPRRSVFAGTTNHSDFLSDPTGSRRFWVISVKETPINISKIVSIRDQLWSQAKHLFESGETSYFTELESLQAIASRNKHYSSYGDYYNDIKDWAESRSCFISRDLGHGALGIDRDAFVSSTFKPMQREITNTLKALDFQSKKVNLGNRRRRVVWVNPDAETHEKWMTFLNGRAFHEVETVAFAMGLTS